MDYTIHIDTIMINNDGTWKSTHIANNKGADQHEGIQCENIFTE